MYQLADAPAGKDWWQPTGAPEAGDACSRVRLLDDYLDATRNVRIKELQAYADPRSYNFV